MKILGIETSCDDTAMAVLEGNPPSRKATEGQVKILSNVISSQVKLHAKYGGVVPSLAAREHTKNIGHVFELALKEARIKNFNKEVDAIAVTRGPGLGPSLLVGISFAKTLSWIFKKPLIGVNHLEGHIYSNWLGTAGNLKNTFPALNLIVSGGHTELVLMRNHGKYEIIGETLDDAVGEAFDKVARLLGLGYPGGPAISKIAEKGNPERYPLPSPMINSKNFNFSYSGLKTAVLYLLRDLKKKKLNKQTKADIAASFQKAALDVLVKKTIKAAEKYKVRSLLLSGGVSANKVLRERLQRESSELGINYSCPPMEYTTDNAAMIAVAGYFSYLKNKKTALGAVPGVGHRPLVGNSVAMDANLGL
ncbi:MAG: tRNA (adenosine(37)-N6)-threonylcarbamoyltransferase complex transferase subunit TsaD [Candidatus Yanofskybacteria bacterium]|nr:tRNA (adenosine(37)-N6)-threonylcarbamoyltransferase complex transferase subunit TsaD [Candidatus Yanofskybacteria bacterium]